MDTTLAASPLAIPHLVDMVVASTRYIGALSDLTDEDMRAPSLLPRWTRGHVVTHVARNADALGNLLHWAETGVEHYMYPSDEERDAAIEAGAGRSAHDLRVDTAASSGRLIQAINELDVRHEDNLVARMPGQKPFPARDVATLRLIELQVHHADLGIGFSHEDWDTDFSELLLDRVLHDRAEEPTMLLRATDTGHEWRYGVEGSGPTVEGRACDLAWWVMARGEGTGLTSDSDDLPALTRWR